ncbi:hypothetical protein [Salmonella enterica]|uniref:hypothetical protein n=1 Tax=Salmonella enterica TaxID=28901 RepID=UPI001F062227|nr:hypothetical protein [Salmonella enterica]
MNCGIGLAVTDMQENPRERRMMMTAYNMTAARQVIIHGDCWPVVSAVQAVVRAMRPECRCDVADSPAMPASSV